MPLIPLSSLLLAFMGTPYYLVIVLVGCWSYLGWRLLFLNIIFPPTLYSLLFIIFKQHNTQTLLLLYYYLLSLNYYNLLAILPNLFLFVKLLLLLLALFPYTFTLFDSLLLSSILNPSLSLLSLNHYPLSLSLNPFSSLYPLQLTL